MEAAHRQTPRRSDPGSAPTSAPEASPEAMTAALAFLFAIRWGAWAIALVLVAFGDLPEQNTHHEPVLLWLTALQVLATMKKKERRLDELANVMEPLPQVLYNVTVKEKRKLLEKQKLQAD